MSHASVFLSYSQEDKPWAEAFAKALRRRGLSLWLDEGDLKAGEDSVDEAVDAALRQSETVVLLLGPGSVERPSLFFELGAALAMRKRIIPILSEGMERSKIPVPLLHGRYLMKKNPQETAQEVAQAVAA